MTRRLNLAALAAAALLLSSLPSRADEVRFKNGDRLSGTVVDMEGGKLKIKSAVAGDVTVDMKDVATFSTDAPVELRLQDGTVIKQRVQAGDAGTVAVAGGGAADGGEGAAARAVPLASVKRINPGFGKWTGAVTVGGLITRGNSNTESANVDAQTTARWEHDRVHLGAGLFYGRQQDEDTGEKDTTTSNWFLRGKYDHFFSEKFYGYALTRVEQDRVADLNLRVSPGVGVGYQWFERPDFNLLTEAGVNWVYEEYEDADSEEHVAARLAYHVDKQFTEKVTVFHNLEYLPSVEDLSDFNLITDAGVRTSLTDKMFAEFKFEWRHDATPAPDAAKNDLRYLLGVGWQF